MSQYNAPDKAIGDPFTALEHNQLRDAHNDTDTRTGAAETTLSNLQEQVNTNTQESARTGKIDW